MLTGMGMKKEEMKSILTNSKKKIVLGHKQYYNSYEGVPYGHGESNRY